MSLAAIGPVLVLHALLGACATPKSPTHAAPDTETAASVAKQQDAAPTSGPTRDPFADFSGLRSVTTHAAGLVVADEPQAALVARDVLEAGGNAADAAVALALTLSVTYPAAGSLGGGGVCLYSDPPAQQVLSIDFLPRKPSGQANAAVPGLLKGIGLLHSIGGSQPWAPLVGPAERLASEGFDASRALALRLKPPAAGVGGLESGTGPTLTVSAGDRLEQPALAGALARIRTGGPLTLYGGDVARTLTVAGPKESDAISLADLGAYQIEPKPAQSVVLGKGITAYLPSGEIGAGALAFDGLKALRGGGAGPSAMAGVLADYGVSGLPQRDFGSTGFITVDRTGRAVACGLTMNGVLGLGRTGPADGIVRARAPRPEEPLSLAGAFLVPAFVFTGTEPSLTLATVGTGGPAGMGDALQAVARFASTPGKPQGDRNNADLAPSDSGHQDRHHLVLCAEDSPRAGGVSALASCRLGLDPRSAGLALAALKRAH